VSTQASNCRWTAAIIRQLLRREHGIDLSKSAVSRLLGQLGLSPQRPLYRSYKQRPKELMGTLKNRILLKSVEKQSPGGGHAGRVSQIGRFSFVFRC
jgi:hypothetical protein